MLKSGAHVSQKLSEVEAHLGEGLRLWLVLLVFSSHRLSSPCSSLSEHQLRAISLNTSPEQSGSTALQMCSSVFQTCPSCKCLRKEKLESIIPLCLMDFCQHLPECLLFASRCCTGSCFPAAFGEVVFTTWPLHRSICMHFPVWRWERKLQPWDELTLQACVSAHRPGRSFAAVNWSKVLLLIVLLTLAPDCHPRRPPGVTTRWICERIFIIRMPEHTAHQAHSGGGSFIFQSLVGKLR